MNAFLAPRSRALAPPRQHSPRNIRVRHLTRPTIPEADGCAVWFVSRLHYASSGREKTRDTNNQRFPNIENGYQISKPAKAIWQKPSNNTLIVAIRQAHGGHFIAPGARTAAFWCGLSRGR